MRDPFRDHRIIAGDLGGLVGLAKHPGDGGIEPVDRGGELTHPLHRDVAAGDVTRLVCNHGAPFVVGPPSARLGDDDARRPPSAGEGDVRLVTHADRAPLMLSRSANDAGELHHCPHQPGESPRDAGEPQQHHRTSGETRVGTPLRRCGRGDRITGNSHGRRKLHRRHDGGPLAHRSRDNQEPRTRRNRQEYGPQQERQDTAVKRRRARWRAHVASADAYDGGHSSREEAGHRQCGKHRQHA